MGKNYKQLSPEERCAIALLQREGKSIRQIGATLDRSASTITREVKRNSLKAKAYEPSYAQLQAKSRRWKGSKLERQPALRDSVLDLLAMGWSPQEVSNRLAREQGCKVVSYESIYRFIYAQIAREKKYTWRHYLPRAKAKRGFYKRNQKGSAAFIKERVSIHKRPRCVQERKSPGHWEADLMLFSKYGQAVLVAHERYSRWLMLFKLDNKQAKPIASHLATLFNSLPRRLARTVTFDNGTEFAEHHSLKELGIKTYFCDVRSPWQKGGVENAIGRLRRVLPRSTNIAEISTTDIEHIVADYNHHPRKCLDYQTPAEVFIKQLLHFKCEFTSPFSRG